MEAHPGDRLLTHGRTVGQHDRVAEIVEVLGEGALPRTASAPTTATNTWFRQVLTPSFSTPWSGTGARRPCRAPGGPSPTAPPQPGALPSGPLGSARRAHPVPIVVGDHLRHRADPVGHDVLP